MPDDRPLPWGEFEGYVRRHEQDDTAHARLTRQIKADIFEVVDGHGERLTDLERLIQRIIGGLILFAALIGGGAIGIVIELARGK